MRTGTLAEMATLNWYKVVWWDNTVEDPYVSNAGDLRGFDAWHLRSGKMISGWDNRAWIQCSDPDYDGDPDDVLANHLGVPIYSFRMRRALEDAGITGIQYLPIRVLHRDGSEIPGYHVANITNKVNALDLTRSEYSVFPEEYFIQEDRGQISSLQRAVLRAEALIGLDVLRLQEFLVFEAVSERFKEAFEAA